MTKFREKNHIPQRILRNISCLIAEDTFDIIDELSRDCGISTGEVIDIIVDSYVEMCNRDGQ